MEKNIPAICTAKQIACFFASKVIYHRETKLKRKNYLFCKLSMRFLYYAYAWYLVLNDKKLFDEPLVAIYDFPLVSSAYTRLSELKKMPDLINIVKSEIGVLPSNIENFLNTIWASYLPFIPMRLNKLTNSEKPFTDAYIRYQQGGSPIISDEAIKDFYTAKHLSDRLPEDTVIKKKGNEFDLENLKMEKLFPFSEKGVKTL